jgi:hypothetical protein
LAVLGCGFWLSLAGVVAFTFMSGMRPTVSAPFNVTAVVLVSGVFQGYYGSMYWVAWVGVCLAGTLAVGLACWAVLLLHRLDGMLRMEEQAIAKDPSEAR